MSNTVTVRCWKIVGVPNVKELLITYANSHLGYDLVICLNCGQLHAASVSHQMYIENLKTRLAKTSCVSCGNNLGEYYAFYPETFLDNSGIVGEYCRSKEYPNDDDSFLQEFPSVY